MTWRATVLAGVGWCSAAWGFQAPDTHPATFHAGARLVQVEVVVRGKRGPVAGLTQDDFTLLDRGKPQRIDVFRAGQTQRKRAAPLPPGTVSNRINSQGEPLASATVVLFDQLNTRFDFKAYESKALLGLIHTLGPRDSLAIYALGKNLHVLQDFTDDPEKLIAALAHVDSGRDLFPANVADALTDFPLDANGEIDPGPGDATSRGMNRRSIEGLAGLSAQVSAGINAQITTLALARIAVHLSGMSGRRNLIWIKEEPMVPPAVMSILFAANIALYPVLIRTVLYNAPDFMATQRAARDLAAPTGGTGFNDAADLQLALRTAEEDAQSSYILGYYPAEDDLDGTYYRLTVKVRGENSAGLEIRYRPGYVASKQTAGRWPAPGTIADILENPLDATAIGLTAELSPDAGAGGSRLRILVDLHDVSLQREGNRSHGKFELGLSSGGETRSRTIDIDLSDGQLAAALDKGFVVTIGGFAFSGRAVRVVVRDPNTGLAGAVTVSPR